MQEKSEIVLENILISEYTDFKILQTEEKENGSNFGL